MVRRFVALTRPATALLFLLWLGPAGGCSSPSAPAPATERPRAAGAVPDGQPSRLPGIPVGGKVRLRDPGPAQRFAVGEPTAPDVPATGPPPAGWVSLVDVAPQLGLDFSRQSGATGRKHYCEPKGGGVAFLDLDGDGWEDVYLVDGGPLPGSPPGRPHANRLFRNEEGRRFVDVSARAGAAGGRYDMGVAAGDYDGDGHPDLFVTGIDGTILYRNRGDGTFEDVTGRTGARVPGWSSSALFVDLDEDGFLDLYVTRYVDYVPERNRACFSQGSHNYCTPHDFSPLPDVILRNEQGRRFVDATRQFVDNPLAGTGLMVAAGDLDDDGHVDLFVANDELPNFLLLGQGGGKFKEDALVAGVAVGSTGFPQAGMGVDVGDVDGDRLLDIVVGNFTDQPVDFFRNRGRGSFSEESSRAGIYDPTYHPLEFGVKLADLDLDGDLDLFVAQGHIWDTVASFQPGVEFPQQNTLLRNRGDSTFENVSSRSGSGLLQRRVSRGVAAADYDHDGDLDLLHINQDSPAVLLRNDVPAGGQWLELELRGTPPNTGAVGARVELHAGGRVQLRQVTAGGGYQSASSLVLHFGLGAARQVDRLVVRWPPPRRGTSELTGVQAGARLLIRQPR